jgi:primosomal protein N'
MREVTEVQVTIIEALCPQCERNLAGSLQGFNDEVKCEGCGETVKLPEDCPIMVE